MAIDFLGLPLFAPKVFLFNISLFFVNTIDLAINFCLMCIATHGTGLTIGNLADLVIGLKFVSGDGEVCDTVSDKSYAREKFRESFP